MPLHSAVNYGASYGVRKVLQEKCQEAAEVYNVYGILPLHLALYKNDSADVFDILLKTFPGAAQVHDNNGVYPLHYAFLHPYLPNDLIDKLLDDEIIKKQDNFGWLLLHGACKHIKSLGRLFVNTQGLPR